MTKPNTKKTTTKGSPKHITASIPRKPFRPARYGACVPRQLPKTVRDPAAPPKGSPRPVRGIGSTAAERSSVPLEWHGHRLSRAAWARYLRISRSALTYRLRHYPVEEALSPDFRRVMIDRAMAAGKWSAKRTLSKEGIAVLRKNALKAHKASVAKATRYEAFGESLTCAEWAARLGVKWHTLYLRLRRMPVEAALRTGKFDELVKQGKIKAPLKPVVSSRRARKPRAASGGTIPFPYPKRRRA